MDLTRKAPCFSWSWFKFNYLGIIFGAAIPVIIIWYFLLIQHRSEQPQVKRYLISSITNLIHELPHELPNDLRILRNQKILEKYQLRVETQPSAQSSFQKLNFDNSCEKTRKLGNKFLKSCSSLLDFLTLCQIFCKGLQLFRLQKPRGKNWQRGSFFPPPMLNRATMEYLNDRAIAKLSVRKEAFCKYSYKESFLQEH